ncbi:phosphatidylethanolamine-binding protein [Sphaerosporella brunnea]|uniref:Phosphatidylethanolamine-binding protein n=1 Tax=Sphaerosporella brunnea TaxID=1250544 RepID=A0A5J5EN77_9PEZI|nr:phosphatidylethanolamine-binding protein [Sphaerosporella brunnea]
MLNLLRPSHISLLLLGISSLTGAQIPPQWTSGFSPAISLTAFFNGVEISTGQSIPLSETKSSPTFALGKNSVTCAESKYIIIALDPDAPSWASPVLHFMNTNFSAAELEEGSKNLTSTNKNATAPWLDPAPPAGTGPHRYIFLLFEQPEGNFHVKDVPGTSTSDRLTFDVERWRKDNHLHNAVAGTYFLAEAAS